MEWELLEGRIDGRPKAAPLSLSHGLVRDVFFAVAVAVMLLFLA